ncbi:hypothetical protein BSLG_009238 [Batrachochytrium salamandrivorans]|nr:hypothetical protein BSLG_009238 [Batrachochytrium salamandrivorans]
MHQVIGKGGFGLVRIVEAKSTKQQYALKYINKKQCVKKDSVENVFRERLLMQELDHPFIINLCFAFQDDEYMFIGLDLALGGDLKFHILRQGGLTERTVKIYSAEIALALSYIHGKQIIHRDLKPENLLIDMEGHVRITDFNVAYSTNNKFPSSRSGTIGYMAPEMFTGKKYNYAVDWWALGVVMFECFYGMRPFRGDDDRQVTSSIKNADVAFPKEWGSRSQIKPPPSKPFMDIMYRLMHKSAASRLCGEGKDGFSCGISSNAWFSDISWSTLYERKILPDFIPDMSKSNFEAAPALEELLLSRDSLSASLSASLTDTETIPVNGDPAKLSEKERLKALERRQMKFIEDHFTVYVQGSGIGMLSKDASSRLAQQRRDVLSAQTSPSGKHPYANTTPQHVQSYPHNTHEQSTASSYTSIPPTSTIESGISNLVVSSRMTSQGSQSPGGSIFSGMAANSSTSQIASPLTGAPLLLPRDPVTSPASTHSGFETHRSSPSVNIPSRTDSIL